MKAAAALVLLVAVHAAAEPRPIHDAEREALTIAAAFLAAGPEALWSRLSPDAPLRALAKEDALRELGVRTGPRESATWTLQTSAGASDAAFHITWASGYDDGLLFRMKQSGGAWTLHEVLTLAEADKPLLPVTQKTRPPIRMPLVAAVLACLLLGLGLRSQYPMVAMPLLLGSIAIGVVIALPFLPRKERPPPPFTELRELERFRVTLARGGEAKVPQEASGAARDVATLWLLQSGVAVQVAGTPSDPIAGLATVAGTPLAEIVRARIALGDARVEEAARAFERASILPPMRDDVLHEAAFSFADDRGDPFVARMRSLGSRNAETYYRQAMTAARKDAGEARRAFRTAWTLEPKAREELVRDADLFALLDNLSTKSLISFYSASEPLQKSPSLASRPIAWPAGANAFTSGELLHVTIGTSALQVPNGAALAPANARVVPATHLQSERDAAALRDAQEMLEDRVTSPSRTRVIRAALALAHHNRWKDVLTLTDDITPRAASVSPALLVLRMRGLLRARRHDDARKLAEGEGVRQLASRNDDPSAIVAIAEAMSNIGHWNTAELLFQAVRGERDAELVAVRLQQLALRRELATNAQTLATEHFDIRHDASINPAIASRIGDLLEAELARLQKKLPRVELRRIVVNVLRWEDFSGGVTMSDHILGLYDGEILFPFAAVEQFKPEIVSIITHELTHALLAQATSDSAPRWFQEGVAQRMELVSRQENVFSNTPPGVVLPLTLLDAVMEKNAEPSAYTVAQTFIRFLEDRFGPNAINQLASEFANGTNTDDALMKLAGKSLDALNADFRQWGFHNNGDFMMSEPWPYHHLYSPGVDPRIKAGFKFGERRP